MRSPKGALATGLVVVLVLLPARATAWVLSEDELEGRSTELGLVVRSFGFFFSGSTLEPPFSATDENPAASSLLDLRLTFLHKTERYAIIAQGQITQRLGSTPIASTSGLGRASPPPRWLPLQFDAVDKSRVRLRLAFDWLYGRVAFGPVTIALGRQPVTLGRGRFWHPLDLIGMFSLTEVDTEYKPGVDALRVDWQMAKRSQLTLLVSAGELHYDSDAELELRGSSLLLRFKQGLSRAELGFSAGFVRKDGVLALDGIVDVKVADLYGELVLHFPNPGSLSPADSNEAVVPKLVIGAQLKPTAKLTVNAELFFNGFGRWQRQQYLQVAASERASIGELTGFGKLYLGASVFWEVHPLLKLTLLALLNPRDPSALLSVAASYSVSSNVELLVGAYGPIGSAPDGLTPRSEYGLFPLFVFSELKLAL